MNRDLRILQDDLDAGMSWLQQELREGTDVAGIQERVAAAILSGDYGHLDVREADATEYRQLRRRGMDAYNQDGRVVYPSAAVVGFGSSLYDLGHEVGEALYREQHGIREAVHDDPREHAAMDAILVLPVLRRLAPEAYAAARRFYETEAPAAERVLMRDVFAAAGATEEAA